MTSVSSTVLPILAPPLPLTPLCKIQSPFILPYPGPTMDQHLLIRDNIQPFKLLFLCREILLDEFYLLCVVVSTCNPSGSGG